ncbi:probable glycosyltransferase at5g03795 [Phtheirospermum japonicum]|uniref:Probable glycosyltransferase at5g03795 n=1 Tax=Phtheirospermum japonicum TaxID=374723 RepID=A0A830D0P5_9LAMI|nr:probable glycosyltransferase at5g03795 [Phtheirospermum japonicum]
METKRPLLFMAFVFSVVLLIQYFELPYGYFLSSLLSFGKDDLNSGVSNHFKDNNYSSTVESVVRNKSLVPEMALPVSSYNAEKNYSLDNLHATKAVPYVASNRSTHVQSPRQNSSSTTKYPATMLVNDEKPAGLTKSDISVLVNSSSTITKKRRIKGPPTVVVPISTMNDMLRQSRVSYRPMKPKWPSQADKELLNTRKLTEGAQIMVKDHHVDVDVYRNYSEFIRSYELMEQTLKIYNYREGEKPIFHQPELDGIYASEGWFMKQLEENKHFVTTNANKAHLFYLPFSSRMLEETLYVPNSHSRKNLVQYLSRYLKTITTKYRFWNRTCGADHFLVACHDWAPSETSRIMKNCIRSLCNADAKGGFQFGKDVSLPETYVRYATNPLKNLGGKPPSQRRILAFFAGKMHGYLRPILLNYWENKDPDMKIFGKLQETKGKMNYIQYMKSSKYCISAKGYEPYTPRVVEAIFYECVPVIISDNYVPPFFETLNWESFAVFVLEKDIPNLKNILLSISGQRYLEMQERVRQVQKHFLWHSKPVKYDVFHMILHSIWYTRVFQID